MVLRQSTFAVLLNNNNNRYAKEKIILIIAFLGAFSLNLKAQYAKTDSTYKRWFIGSTVFILGNLATTNPPNFAQINLGYRITGKDVITLEAKTWKYALAEWY